LTAEQDLLDQLQELSADGDVSVFPTESLNEDDEGVLGLVLGSCISFCYLARKLEPSR